MEDSQNIRWAEAAATVRFDLEEGQVVDFVYPQKKYPPGLVKQLGYMSFPDSYAFAPEGELFYFFLVDYEGTPIYCYTYFTQRRDSTNPRGYFQKSIVILSKLRIARLFKVILRQFHKLYFENDMDEMMIQRALVSLNANEPPASLICADEKFVINIIETPLKVFLQVCDSLCRLSERFQRF